MADYNTTDANVEVLSGATTEEGTAGVAFGALAVPVWLSSADGKLYKCDADVEAQAVCVGVTFSYASANSKVYYVSEGPMNIGATTAVGDTIVVSTNVGKLAPEADLATNDYYTVVGHAYGNGTVYIRPYASGVQHA